MGENIGSRSKIQEQPPHGPQYWWTFSTLVLLDARRSVLQDVVYTDAVSEMLLG